MIEYGSVNPPVAERRRAEAEARELAVLYEDEWLIAIDKPPGMVVHPTYRNWTGTLLNALLWRVRDREGVLPRIITRLDKDTSGLVLIALTGEVHAQVQRDAAGMRVRKEYLAVVCGEPRPRCGTIALPLARDVADRRRVVVTPDGAASETRYEVVGSADAGARSLMRCELVTGRTHQIRVHLAARGWPIVGDPVYGEACPAPEPLSRQALHAWRLTLPHPVSRERLAIEAPLPADLLSCFPFLLPPSSFLLSPDS